MNDFPESIMDEAHLEEVLSRPSEATVKMFKELDGDLIFLGIAGKSGPSWRRWPKGVEKRILGVSRFSSPEDKKRIESLGKKRFWHYKIRYKIA